jgi:hypothetical protein
MRLFGGLAIIGCAAVLTVAAAWGGAPSLPPQDTQTPEQFAASNTAASVTAVDATAQKQSCYRPELAVLTGIPGNPLYPNGGGSPCNGAPTTGENVGPYATQDTIGAANPVLAVKDHSESDIRVDPTNPNHLIGQSKWIVNAENYNHLLGFYESFDGGQTWPVQGHVPGYEGWTDNTDPVGAFDQYGNFYSLVLGYNFYYSKAGDHQYNNGSNQVNPAQPPEVVAVSVHPHGATGPNDWITTHTNSTTHVTGPDFVSTAKNANTSDPDKQWIAIDTSPTSKCEGTIYAMWTNFILSPSYVFVSTAQANPDGTHTDWSTPQILPTVNGKPWDTYLLPHIAPDGTVYTSYINNPKQHQLLNADISLISHPCGGSWQGPTPIVQNVTVPTYRNTTFREGILETFAVGNHLVNGSYPLYLSYEDGSSGGSNVYLTGSFDGGATWTTPFLVNDNDPRENTEALQPNIGVAPNGTVAVAFYDRRLLCPSANTADWANAGLQFDPNAAGAADYCVNTAIQFYDQSLHPLGHNIRLSANTWDPQVSAPHTKCPCDPETFIGDYFGIDSGGGYTYTTSVSTFNDSGHNPSNYQQQIVSRIATP